MEPYSLNLVDPWRADAACKGMDADWFHPVRGTGAPTEQRAVCERCPVSEQCLKYALDHRIMEGIWGGTTGKQRLSLRRECLIITKRCALCNDVFETRDDKRGRQRLYCSRPCKDHASYQRRKVAS